MSIGDSNGTNKEARNAKAHLGLANLPPEVVLEHLLPSLPPGDIANVSQVDKRLHLLAVSLLGILESEDRSVLIVGGRVALARAYAKTPRLRSDAACPSLYCWMV